MRFISRTRSLITGDYITQKDQYSIDSHINTIESIINIAENTPGISYSVSETKRQEALSGLEQYITYEELHKGSENDPCKIYICDLNGNIDACLEYNPNTQKIFPTKYDCSINTLKTTKRKIRKIAKKENESAYLIHNPSRKIGWEKIFDASLPYINTILQRSVKNRFNLGDGFRMHIYSAIAQMIVYTPIFAALEVPVMSDEQSLCLRVLEGTATLFGGGWVLSKLRQLGMKLPYIKKLFNLDKPAEKKNIKSYDTLFVATYYAASAIPLYFSSSLVTGKMDPETLSWCVATHFFFGPMAGALLGYAMDFYTDLAGITKSDRPIPKSIRNLKSRYKKPLLAAITAASMALTVGIYAASSDTLDTEQIKQEFDHIPVIEHVQTVDP